ncbi:hypothetical protein [Streptomyces sp. RM72]|uniref:hypothetical protein n=1 Tax=Streptomyces sp. RM72 TaxID=1115510 RepID=UPI0024947929|nr:hypothetical protein [Streptomyces sp. RM72]
MHPATRVPFWALAWGPPAASVYSRTAKVHETVGDHRAAAEHYALAAIRVRAVQTGQVVR